MKDVKVDLKVNPTFYFKLKIRLIGFFENKQWFINLLNDIKANPKRYFSIETKVPPDNKRRW